MSLIPVYYSVVISKSAPNNLEPGSPQGKEGFIDYISVEAYRQLGPDGLPIITTQPSSVANAQIKAQAFYRYKRMVEYLNETISIYLLYNFDNGGATVNTSGTQLSFTVAYDRADYVYTYNELYGTSDPTGTTKILTGTTAIQRQVARIFANDNPSILLQGFQPLATVTGTPPNTYELNDTPLFQLDILAPATGVTLADRLNYAEANITVTQVPLT